ncbi:putative ATP-dependent RNA helicase DDX49 [Saccoglossus kowalevskii]|uniref:RNA helicase n=1 Tax=Saccoglossus kowalevskii TaxID=10224 RepID=A0ABM0GR94_SACKO|nr:PREDICTED: probable ATP-dependent RNA helicase DDX49-like [Saccoglossus kowalevskii]
MADIELEDGVNAKFSSLGLNDWLVKQCKAVGITKPTPIQYYCIPQILEGVDCLGCAKTGSGKTAAFALPILQKLCEDPYGIYALVLTPTRELAFQIAEQFRILGKPIGLKDAVIIGGRDVMRQGMDLADKPHVVIATPGRLADHINSSNTFSLKKIKFLVLDEADRLLEDTFAEDLQVIFDALPEKRQTLLFSATLTDKLEKLQTLALNKPFFWQSKAEIATVEQLDQKYVLIPAKVRDAYLVHILQKICSETEDYSMIIFSNTCKNCQSLYLMLKALEFPCTPLHSMIPQRDRIASLAQFKSGRVRILLATDVASRGLDIPIVQLVVNHNVPWSPIDYVHRVGRTARAGRGGMALTLMTQYDVKLIEAIEKQINTKLTEYPVDDKEVLTILNEVSVAKREAEMRLEEQDFGERKTINKRKKLIREGRNPDKVLNKKKKRRKEKK